MRLLFFGGPPATTFAATYAAAAQSASASYTASETPPGSTCAYAAAAQPATASYAATETPPARTTTYAATAQPATGGYVASALASGSASYIAVAQPATASYGASGVPPARTTAYAALAQPATATYVAAASTPGSSVAYAAVSQSASASYLASGGLPTISGAYAAVARSATGAYSCANTAPGTAPSAPDPDETVWTLGPGGAAWDGRLGVGFALTLSTTLMNNGVALAFPGSATLDAAIWPGGSEAAVITPSTGWDSANGGAAAGRLLLTISASQATTLDPGEYRFQVGVTSGGVRSLAYDGPISLVGAPGVATLPSPYGSSDAMAIYFPQIGTLQSRKADTTGFLAQRSRARTEMDRRVINLYDPRSGMTRNRQPTMDPYYQSFDVPVPPTTVIPDREAITLALAAGGLILEDKVIEMVSKWAIAYVLEGQMTAGRDYQAEADRMRMSAEGIWKCYQAQVDLDGDGRPDVLIDRDCTLLPAGAAP